jgi:hypothetical protein
MSFELLEGEHILELVVQEIVDINQKQTGNIPRK